MAYDEGLAERIREILADRTGVTEKRMFGGLAFLIRGHMGVGIVKDKLMVRVGPESYDRVLKDRHVRKMDFTGKPMKGLVYVLPAGYESDADLERWVGTGAGYVTGLPPKRQKKAAKPVLLAGGNPRIAKADGDDAVQAYIEAMPGWKRDIGRGLDALVVRTVPGVKKAVRWNSPFYGIEGRGWFLSFHCFTKYVKVTFFRGAALHPLPPGESKNEDVRYLDIHEGELDESRVATWVKQAAKLPGWGNA